MREKERAATLLKKELINFVVSEKDVSPRLRCRSEGRSGYSLVHMI